MNKTQLSIIIPVYNGAEYIGECLNSIIFQDNSHSFEIIVIDDGSIDNTHDIVRKYMAMHPNISLLRQRNAGVAAARNAGIRASHGKYITFVDADDKVGAAPEFTKNLYRHSIRQLYSNDIKIFRTKNSSQKAEVTFSSGYFKEMLDIAAKTDSDAVLGGKITRKSTRDTEYFTGHIYDTSTIYNATPAEKATLLYQADLRESANAVLFRRSFLRKNKLSFLNGMHLDEDMLFCMLAVLKAKRVASAPDTIYLYNRHSDSLSNFTNEGETRYKYGIANIQRFSILLNELKNSKLYAPLYNYWLKAFSKLGQTYPDQAKHYPPMACTYCPHLTCNDCFIKQHIDILIKNNIETFMPQR